MIKLRLLLRFCSWIRLFSFVFSSGVRGSKVYTTLLKPLNQTVLKELLVLWDKAMRSIGVLITHMSPKRFLSVQPAPQAHDIALRRRAEELLVVAAEV